LARFPFPLPSRFGLFFAILFPIDTTILLFINFTIILKK